LEPTLSLPKYCRRLWLSESGQGLVEYSLILAVLSAGLVAVSLVLRNSTGNLYNGTRNSVDQAIACSNGTSTACAVGGTDGGSGNGNGNGNGGGNGQGNNGNGNGNGGGNGSNGQGGGKGNKP